MFEDGEPDGPGYIFGDTSSLPGDIVPTVDRPKRFRPFRRVKDNDELRRCRRRVLKAVTRKKNPLQFATPATLPKPDTPKYEDTYVEIPDDSRKYRHPVFGINPDIVRDDDEFSPEREAEQRLPVENIVEYDPAMLEAVSDRSDALSKDIQQILLSEGAAFLMSYDEATSAAAAALRDGLGVTAEIDSSVSETISHMLRLSMVQFYLDRTSLTKWVKRRFLRNLTDKISDDAHASINKALVNEKYRSALDNLRARTSPGTLSSTPESELSDIAGQLGVVKRRSRGGLTHPRSDDASDQHDYNERQNAGVRVRGS